MRDYPAEYFLNFSADDYREGRITVHQKNDSNYWVEIDVVQKESRKIVMALDRLYNLSDPDEAVDLAVQKLATFVRRS